MAPGTEPTPAAPAWWARGLLFENCSCTVVCPGHVHFDQNCTHERCVGYWAILFRDGVLGDVSLAGARAVIGYDTPQRMIDGGWTETIVIDREATDAQRAAVEAILTGAAGGPWAALARFVSRRTPTRFLPIRIEDGPRAKRVAVDGVLDGRVEAIRGRDRGQPVTFANMFNQIHAPTQVIARGETRYDDGTIVVATRGTHALWSDFDWSVAPGASGR